MSDFSNEREMLMKLLEVTTRVEEKVSHIEASIGDQQRKIDKLETRVRVVEERQFKIMGAVLVVSMVASYVIPLIIKKLGG